MLTMIVALGGALVIGLLVVATVFLIGMRHKWPWLLDVVIRLSRVVFNPVQMRSAGKPGAFASVIRHRGRSSGRMYETPVGAVPSADGFVIALPYGRRASWLRNVLANGSAAIVHEGRVHEVDDPEVVALESVEEVFSPGDRRSHRLFGVEECLRLRRVVEHEQEQEAGLEWSAA